MLKIIDHSIPLDHVLIYRDRGIRYSRVVMTDKIGKIIPVKEDKRVFLYLYEDVKLRGEVESNLIVLMKNRRIKRYDATKLGRSQYSQAWNGR